MVSDRIERKAEIFKHFDQPKLLSLSKDTILSVTSAFVFYETLPVRISLMEIAAFSDDGRYKKGTWTVNHTMGQSS